MLAHLIGLIQQLYGDTKFVKTLFSTRQALEKQATGRTFLKRRHLVGDMGKYATLCWNIPFVGGFLDGVENAQGVLNRLGNRVHADNRITAAIGQALVDLNHDAVEDRKSTRLNSSHVRISYAVF